MSADETFANEDWIHDTADDPPPARDRQTTRLPQLLIGVALAAVLAAVVMAAALLWPASSTASATPTQDSVDAGLGPGHGNPSAGGGIVVHRARPRT
ncbi:hypothetical protein AB0M41_13720 [Streptomyces sp. NPDC051896]|uniref:hypothetical protein n=1 Tax=Streptomyces sp. NPDC051896 TaxID=3155416 RepID=UPI00342EE05C